MIYTESWFPICEDCPDDASSLVQVEGVWQFHCDVHRGWSDVPVRRVWEGWTPADESGWAAAAAAVRGVRQPLWLVDVGGEAFWLTLEEAEDDWVVREDYEQVYAVPLLTGS